MLLGDFHIHSTFSDGKLSIPEIVDFYGKRGFQAIAVTDHLCENRSVIGKAARYIDHTLTEATFNLYQKVIRSESERAFEKYGMILIPGVEVTKNSISNSRSAHILALGVEEWIDPNLDPKSLSDQIRSQNGLMIAAHPVNTGKREKQTYHLWDNREEFSSLFDAWEVASGAFLFEEVAKSGLPIIANSDLHRPSQIHSWKTMVDAKADRISVLEAIRKQQLQFFFYDEVEVSHDFQYRVDVNLMDNSYSPDHLRYMAHHQTLEKFCAVR